MFYILMIIGLINNVSICASDESIQMALDADGNIPEFLKVMTADLTFENTQSSFRYLREHLADIRSFIESLGQHSHGTRGRKWIPFEDIPLTVDTLIIKIPVDTLLQFDCIHAETHSLGVHNSLVSIAGHRLTSRERILKLQIENMELRNASIDSINQLKSQYQQAKKELDKFLMTNSYWD